MTTTSGVGKTAAAEAIADYTKRPLLALTCGGLGTYTNEVEKKLRQYLDWGELWGAVVLLDEADIYLEKRNLTDVHRNSLVSVFLRALEYFKGLLFLTTNRVTTLDEAFTSRIHVALHYRKLQDSERREIWLNSFERLEPNRVKVAKAVQRYACDSKDVLSLEWNGREIRNAFQTAISLAEFDAEEDGEELVTVRKEHLEKVVHLSAHFQDYLATMHRGKSESEIAKKRGLRNDSYGEAPKGRDKKPLFRNKVDEDKDEDEDEEDDRQRRKANKASRQKSNRRKDTDEDSGEGASRKTGRGKKPIRHSNSDDEESEVAHPKNPKKPKKPQGSDEESEVAHPKNPKKPKKPRGSDEDEDKVSESNLVSKPSKSKKVLPMDDEEEEEPIGKKVAKKPTRPRLGDDEETD